MLVDTDFQTLFSTFLPRLLGALAILVIGWIVALVVAMLVRRILHRTSFDNRLAAWIAGSRAQAVPIEQGAGTVAFWVVMLFVLVAVFETLQLTVVTQPLNALLAQVAAFVPKLLGAIALALTGWVVAVVVRRVVTRTLAMTGADDRLAAEGSAPRLSSTVGEAAYWLVWLLFLPALLSTLELTGLLEPVQALLSEAMAFLPNLFAAALVLVGGWFVATLIRRITGNLLASVGVDRFGQRTGVSRALGHTPLSATIAMVVYVLVLVPVAIAALNALQIAAVTAPASNMLDALLAAVPRLFGAAIVLVLAWTIARVVSDLVSRLLAGVGFDRLFVALGITAPQAPQAPAAAVGGQRWRPSQVAGAIVLAAILVFAAIEAAGLLEFTALQALLSALLVLAGRILLGLVIFGVGLYGANVAARVIRGSRVTNAGLLASAAHVAILVLVGAMALREMGLANEIINLAFGLTFGAVAVAVALAFGLGARDVAGRQVEEWRRQVRGDA